MAFKLPKYFFFRHSDKCVSIKYSKATINTKEIFSTFDFNADWIKDQRFWNDYFEDKYEEINANGNRLPLKVFILPHSHTGMVCLSSVARNFSRGGFANFLYRKILGGGEIFRFFFQKP